MLLKSKKPFLYLSALASLVLLACASEPIDVQTKKANIVDGQDLPEGSVPAFTSQLEITKANGGTSSCTGALVDPYWVLTAAHCLNEGGSDITPASRIVVNVGRDRLAPAARVAASEVRVHPQYDLGRDVNGGFDVAMIKLASPVLNVPTVSVADGRTPPADFSPAVAIGFGQTPDSGNGITRIVQFKGLAVLSDTLCQQPFDRLGISNASTIMCAEFSVTDLSSDLCPGDSGGPLLQFDATGRPYVVGVSSFIATDDQGRSCRRGQLPSPGLLPSYFADLTERSVASFVQETLNPGFIAYKRYLPIQKPSAPAAGQTVLNAADGLRYASFFDEQYYLRNNPDVAEAVRSGDVSSGYVHFFFTGQFQGRSPSILIDEQYYLRNNPDVAAEVASGSISSGIWHFLTSGHLEGRSPSAYFNSAEYLASNPEVAAALPQGNITSAFAHYIEAGIDEGRSPKLSLYSESFYLASNPDIAAAVGAGTLANGFEHFKSSGQFENRVSSSLFSPANYLAANPDIAGAVASGAFPSAFRHYVDLGRFEFRTN